MVLVSYLNILKDINVYRFVKKRVVFLDLVNFFVMICMVICDMWEYMYFLFDE